MVPSAAVGFAKEADVLESVRSVGCAPAGDIGKVAWRKSWSVISHACKFVCCACMWSFEHRM